MKVVPGRSHATMPRFRPKAVDDALVTGGRHGRTTAPHALMARLMGGLSAAMVALSKVRSLLCTLCPDKGQVTTGSRIRARRPLS